MCLRGRLNSTPRSAATYRVLGEVKRFSTTDPHLVGMQKLAREIGSLSPDDQVHLHFALAKAYEDLGDHEQSAFHLIKGNALKRQQINYDEVATLDFFVAYGGFSPGLMHDKRNVGDPSASAGLYHRHAAFRHDLGRANTSQPSAGVWRRRTRRNRQRL